MQLVTLLGVTYYLLECLLFCCSNQCIDCFIILICIIDLCNSSNPVFHNLLVVKPIAVFSFASVAKK